MKKFNDVKMAFLLILIVFVLLWTRTDVVKAEKNYDYS